MPATAGYLLQEDGRVTGPHSLVVLRQKAEIRVLRPESLVRRVDASAADEGPWVPIHDIPELRADLFPTRAAPKLAAAAIPVEHANAAYDATHADTDVFALLRENSARLRAAEGYLLKDIGPRPNKRLRDYVICFLALNLFIAFAGQFVGYVNPYLVGLAVMGNVSLFWTLFFVMDRY